METDPVSAAPIVFVPFIGESTSWAVPPEPAAKNSCTGVLDWAVSSPPHTAAVNERAPCPRSERWR